MTAMVSPASLSRCPGRRVGWAGGGAVGLRSGRVSAAAVTLCLVCCGAGQPHKRRRTSEPSEIEERLESLICRVGEKVGGPAARGIQASFPFSLSLAWCGCTSSVVATLKKCLFCEMDGKLPVFLLSHVLWRVSA